MRSLLVATILLGACGDPAENPHQARSAGIIEGRLVPSHPPRGGEWRMAPGDYANTRYSSLDQIHTGNVAGLKTAWVFDTGAENGHEAAPLIVGDTLYAILPYPNALIALNSVSGALKWRYDPQPVPSAKGVACCDVVNRGGAYWEGRIYYATLDGHAVAVAADSGREVWKTLIGNIGIGETITMAPLVVKGKVLIGNSGGEFGVRGWLKALDARTGEVVWTAYSTGPDKDVLIGPEFRPFYQSDRGTDLGVKSWPPQHWKIGGGNVWGWISYDAELDLIYHGTGNPGPWNPELRPGDNKWTAGMFARRPDTGQAVWAYQWSPHDLYDHDGVNELLLLDLEIGGQRRKVLVRPERNGYVYVMDRVSGEVLSATPFVHITSSKGVDLKTGRLIPVPEKEPGTGRIVRGICPFASGAKDWNPSAFSAKTGWIYIPHNNMCQDEEGTEVGYIAGTPYLGANVRMYAGPGGHRGQFTAWDPVARKAMWHINETFPVWSGVVATAGNLVFYGTMDGRFRALDARTGKVLWETATESGIVGQPVTYLGSDGKQYVAVMAGVGGWAGAIVSLGLDPRDATAGLGFVQPMRDLPEHTRKGGKLYVYSLP